MGNLLGEDMQRLKQAARNPQTKRCSPVVALDMSENAVGLVGARWLAMLLDPDTTSYQSSYLPSATVISDLQASSSDRTDLVQDRLV